ncbi:MAG: hypothetical protein ACQGVC_19980 [Myxococcota bacterium]
MLVGGFALLLPLAALADEDCAARATQVVEQMERESGRLLAPAEARMAYQAALAGCEPERPTQTAAVAEPDEAGSRLDRFVAGLFAMEPRPAKRRPGGKFRYLEKD